MAKSESKQQLQKACYGTKEWSKNSGICCNCKLQKECGKVENKLKPKHIDSTEDYTETE